MDIRLHTNPSMRAAYLKNQIEAAAAKKPAASRASASRSQDTVVLSKEAIAAYSGEKSTKNAVQTTAYGFGPGQTGWQDWVHIHAEELTAKIMAGIDQQIANRTYAAPRTASVPEKTAETNETEREPAETEEPEEPEEPEELDESTWKGPWTIPAYGKRQPMPLPVERLWLGDGVLLEPIRK